MMKTLIFATVLLQTGVLFAAPVSDVRARVAASAYLGQNYAPSSIAKAARRLATPSLLSAGTCRELIGAEGVIGFVVQLSPSGFIVVRADDELSPVKLHSAVGSYESLPVGFRAVIEAELAGELTELAGMRTAKQTPEARFRETWRLLTSQAASVDETPSLVTAAAVTEKSAGTTLLTTQWAQTSPFNIDAPLASGGSGGHASAGCGPVAMSQILRYHKKPAAPLSDFSYTDREGSSTGVHRISDAGGLVNYDWSNMPNKLTAASALVQKQAVGRLVYHCGVAMETDYEAGASSVISQLHAARALREIFGYTCEDYQTRSEYTTSAWFGKIEADVDAKHPVYYTMVSNFGGHAVVCDGYRNGNEIHLNFGVAGYGDAWYNIDSVVFYGYAWSYHEAVFGITPDTTPVANTLTVVNGTGGGAFLAGTSVEVSADTPPDGHLFNRWNTEPEDADLGSGFVATQTVTSVTMPNDDVTLTAVYRVWPPEIGDPGTQQAMVGIAFSLPLDITFATRTTVTGLPKGLQYNASTKSITGIPAAAVNNQIITVVAKNGTATTTRTFTTTVASLPTWATGSFSGWFTHETLGLGTATMTVTTQGKATGKFSFAGTNYTFSAGSYSNGYIVTATASAGKARLPVTVVVSQATDDSAPVHLGVAEGWLESSAGGDDPNVVMYRTVWKDTGFSAVVSNTTGYYTAVLPGDGTYGSGYLTFTVDKAGKVKTAGKLADGTAVSQSGTLILDETGRMFAVVYAAPTAYKGGSLFGWVECVRPDAGDIYLRPLDGAPFLWSSLNPTATQEYGAGFTRELGLDGGWYSKTGDLGAYYAGLDLTVAAATNAAAPELTVGTVRYDSVWWNPTGIALTPFLKSGALAGLTAPAAGKPTDVDKDGVWNYSATNSVGLKISLARPTGIFKGSFLAWFDYAGKHTSKKMAFEGALTPVREDPSDGIEGRSYFLWADKAVIPATGKTYSFSWSYDLLVQSAPLP